MTPYKAINELRNSGKTLAEIRKLLGKRRVKTSIATLWRIMFYPEHEASYKLSMAIIELNEVMK